MKVLHYLIVILIVSICAGTLPFLFGGQKSSLEWRGEASRHLRAVDVTDYAANIETVESDERMLSMRAEAEKRVFTPEFISAVQFIEDVPGLVVLNEKADSRLPEDVRPVLAPLFAQDGTVTPRLFAAMPKDWEDAIDVNGDPVRWRLPENLLAGYSVLRPARPKVAEVAKAEIVTSMPRLPKMSASARAAHYREIVNNFANRYNLSSDLVMAIIHSESDFTPTLVSNKSAMGLMQLLPSTASDEVHRFLYGKRGQVSFEQLRIPEVNIRYGTAYLHILLNRYFPNVKNRVVQEACAIASYNMGPNRFLRLYGSNNDAAIARINSMDEEAFLADLLRRLPVRETRYYVEKVRRMKKHYSSLP